ncbi:MAG: trypsin-like peptidase domain-containing protein [Saprospiraceae bacterium]|nr:trypsin-like peptidase domain-containing protein [Saprospiraceae bacterium]MBK9929255.1 trypsin-like peptidase domain-containing protein [Saprospiraceae bacterium]
MKSLISILLAAILSSGLTVFFYSKRFPQKILVREPRAVFSDLRHSAVPEVEGESYSDAAKDHENVTSTELAFESKQNHVELPNFRAAAQKSTAAVVFIKSTEIRTNRYGYEYLDHSSGSGVILSADGYIVTNHHVIETGATDLSSNIEVTLNSKEKYQAKIIGDDPSTDVALLKIEAKDLPFLTFDNSDELEIGDWVLAIGNPDKLRSTVTAGIVSAKGRNINILGDRDLSIESFIQTDAVVNPGNSGGALVNTSGALVGINTAILTHTGNYEGYSFAIPSNLVKKVIEDLKQYGKTQRAFLGITLNDDIDNQKVKDLQLPNHTGVLVEKVYESSAAEDAGIQPGDVILKMDQSVVTSNNELHEKIGSKRPGDEVGITFYRAGKTFQTLVKLKDINNKTTIDNSNIHSEKILVDQGFEIRDLNPYEKTRFKINGVRVVGIYKGSVVDQCNMQTGYIITQINGQMIKDCADFIKKLKNLSSVVDLTGFYDFDTSNSIYPYKFKKAS